MSTENAESVVPVNVDPKTWVTVLQTVGFPVVACLAVFWFANRAIEYERDRMTPALEGCAKAIEGQSQCSKSAEQTMQQANETMKSVREALIRLETKK